MRVLTEYVAGYEKVVRVGRLHEQHAEGERRCNHLTEDDHPNACPRFGCNENMRLSYRFDYK